MSLPCMIRGDLRLFPEIKLKLDVQLALFERQMSESLIIFPPSSSSSIFGAYLLLRSSGSCSQTREEQRARAHTHSGEAFRRDSPQFVLLALNWLFIGLSHHIKIHQTGMRFSYSSELCGSCFAVISSYFTHCWYDWKHHCRMLGLFQTVGCTWMQMGVYLLGIC